MAKVFIGIALVFMLVTAGLGFALKSNVDKLQSALTAAKGKITTAEGNARAAKSDAEKAQKEAKDANDKADAATKTAEAKTKEAADNKQAADELRVVVDTKDSDIRQPSEKVFFPWIPTPPPRSRWPKRTCRLQN